MITKFESSVKISFELSRFELKELFNALNSAEVAIMEKCDNCQASGYKRYYEDISKLLDSFVANFNPAKLND